MTDKMWPSPARILIIQLKQVDKWTQNKGKHGLAKVMCGLMLREHPPSERYSQLGKISTDFTEVTALKMSLETT